MVVKKILTNVKRDKKVIMCWRNTHFSNQHLPYTGNFCYTKLFVNALVAKK